MVDGNNLKAGFVRLVVEVKNVKVVHPVGRPGIPLDSHRIPLPLSVGDILYLAHPIRLGSTRLADDNAADLLRITRLRLVDDFEELALR